jgi:hypothetical protein
MSKNAESVVGKIENVDKQMSEIDKLREENRRLKRTLKERFDE